MEWPPPAPRGGSTLSKCSAFPVRLSQTVPSLSSSASLMGDLFVGGGLCWWRSHAPNYMHLPFILYTGVSDMSKEQVLKNKNFSGPNNFISQGAPSDFGEAKITLRLRGLNYDGRGAKLAFLVQGRIARMAADQTLNFVYTGQFFNPTPEWTEQTLTISTNPKDWQYPTCIQPTNSVHYCLSKTYRVTFGAACK